MTCGCSSLGRQSLWKPRTFLGREQSARQPTECILSFDNRPVFGKHRTIRSDKSSFAGCEGKLVVTYTRHASSSFSQLPCNIFPFWERIVNSVQSYIRARLTEPLESKRRLFPLFHFLCRLLAHGRCHYDPNLCEAGIEIGGKHPYFFPFRLDNL